MLRAVPPPALANGAAAAFHRLTVGLHDVLADVLKAEAEAILAQSQGLVPVVTGRLRDSGFVEASEQPAEAAVGYGGASAPYALAVHEALHEIGADGRGPKFLERAVGEALPGMAARMADALGRELEA